jgi:hypothetical protein
VPIVSEEDKLNVDVVLKLQPKEVKLPQVPENNSTTVPELARLVSILLNETVVMDCTAVKLYHTSSSAVPPQEGTATPELVPPIKVPAVLLHEVFEVSDVADAQLSFAGGGAG